MSADGFRQALLIPASRHFLASLAKVDLQLEDDRLVVGNVVAVAVVFRRGGPLSRRTDSFGRQQRRRFSAVGSERRRILPFGANLLENNQQKKVEIYETLYHCNCH